MAAEIDGTSKGLLGKEIFKCKKRHSNFVRLLLLFPFLTDNPSIFFFLIQKNY